MSEYDDWSDELGRLAESITVMPGATALVQGQVQRRKRRRSVVTVLASAAVVVAVAGGGFALSRHPGAGSVPVAEGPTTAGSGLFSCPDGWETPSNPPPIHDLEQQHALIDAIEARSWAGFSIHYAKPTHLGVVALIDGDLKDAEAQLVAAGASYVFAWDPSMAQAGVDAAGQTEMATQSEVKDVLREVVRIRFDVDGYAGTALWHEASAVILMWKAPVPPEVAALAGVRANGVEVMVWPADYSSRELAKAQHRSGHGRYPILLDQQIVAACAAEPWTSHRLRGAAVLTCRAWCSGSRMNSMAPDVPCNDS